MKDYRFDDPLSPRSFPGKQEISNRFFFLATVQTFVFLYSKIDDKTRARL